jgi:cell wall-associated NlpC family hydrolase
VRYYADVYDYDRDLLTSLQETKQQVADLKVQVEGEKAELEDMQAAYEEQEASLNTMISSKKTQMSDFDSKLASAKALAAQYKETIEKQNQIIKEEEERQAAEAAAAAAAEAAAKEAAAKEAAAKAAAQQQQAAQSSQSSSSSSSGSSQSSESSSSSSDTTQASSSTTDTSKNPSYTTGVSGSSVVSYACQFVGNPYVWGGTDPNTGADCSGFTQYVFAHFGISLPRTSGEQRSAGQEVSYANAQPGDLICYSGHVAIYMGGGRIVHAQSTAVGITTGNATYRTILSVRRVL